MNKIKAIGKNLLKSVKNKLDENLVNTIGCFILILSGCGDINSGREFAEIRGSFKTGFNINAHNTSKLIDAIGFTKIGVGLILLGKKTKD